MASRLSGTLEKPTLVFSAFLKQIISGKQFYVSLADQFVALCKLCRLYLIHGFNWFSVQVNAVNECTREQNSIPKFWTWHKSFIHSKINLFFRRLRECFSKRSTHTVVGRKRAHVMNVDSKRENLRGTHVIQLPTCNTIKSSSGGKYDDDDDDCWCRCRVYLFTLFSLLVSLSLQI